METKRKGQMKQVHKVTIIQVLLIAVALVADYFFGAVPDGMVQAQLLTTLITGAAVNTSLNPISQVESNILIGDVDTAMPLRGLSVKVGGKTTIDIQGSQPLMSVFAKFCSNISAAIVGLVLKIATGRINAEGSSIVFTNDGATVPQIFGHSFESAGVPIEAATSAIVALDNRKYSDFSGLFITPAANVNYFDVEMEDGTNQPMTVVEADAAFSLSHPTQADGRLDALVTGFDNRDRKYKSVRVYATTAVTVLLVKLPDSYFASLKK